MIIKIDDTYYRIHEENGSLYVNILEVGTISAEDLPDLVERLEGEFESVSLPEDIFTSNISHLDYFVRMGFQYLKSYAISIHNQDATLTPAVYWSNRMTDGIGSDRMRRRMYRASWEAPNGQRWSHLLDEREVEGLLRAQGQIQ